MTESNSFPFPHPELTALADSRPTFVSLQLLLRELQSNAESVPSIRGNGNLGHLSLTMSAADFLVESGGIAFIPPEHPGAEPDHPDAATGPIITEINRKFLADQKEYTIYNNVAGHLKRQLSIKAVPPLYLEVLSHPSRHFSRLTVLDILNHLHTEYGTITSDDLATNRENLQREWSSAQPLESLWTNIIKCRQIAHDRNPISDMDAVQAALNQLERSGVFTDAVKFWRIRPEAERTFANIKAHFKLADLERQRELTSKSAGYHGAALAHGTPKAESGALTASSTSTTSSTAPNIKYCWTHGINANGATGHTSAECTRRATGHNLDATIFNMLGGNNMSRRQRGEQAIYKPRGKALAAVPPAPAANAPTQATTTS